MLVLYEPNHCWNFKRIMRNLFWFPWFKVTIFKKKCFKKWEFQHDYAYICPFQYSCLENPVDGGVWWAAVHRVAQSWTRWGNLACIRACIGEGNGNPLQYSSLENPRDGGAWWSAVYGVSWSRTRLKQLSRSSSSMLVFLHWKSWEKKLMCFFFFYGCLLIKVQLLFH